MRLTLCHHLDLRFCSSTSNLFCTQQSVLSQLGALNGSDLAFLEPCLTFLRLYFNICFLRDLSAVLCLLTVRCSIYKHESFKLSVCVPSLTMVPCITFVTSFFISFFSVAKFSSVHRTFFIVVDLNNFSYFGFFSYFGNRSTCHI